MYPGEAVPVGPGFVGPRSIEEQTEPVDFSTANEPVNFSSGVRPVPGFSTATGAAGGYSRESTPDSGGSHYLDTYRDANGKTQAGENVSEQSQNDITVSLIRYVVRTGSKYVLMVDFGATRVGNFEIYNQIICYIFTEVGKKLH